VLLDSELQEMEHTATPSVRPPRAHEMVWRDDSDRPERCLTIWRPIPFPGCDMCFLKNPTSCSLLCIRDRKANSD
jgi:hypothetical protein